MEPQIIVKEIHTYGCPICGAEYKLYQQARDCAAHNIEILKVKGTWDPESLKWYNLRVLHGKTESWVLVYDVKVKESNYHAQDGSCKKMNWELYDLNWNQYFTSENWEFLKAVSLKDGWDDYGLYPRMEVIMGGQFSRIHCLNDCQKNVLRQFWNDVLVRQVRAQIGTMTLEQLYEYACHSILGYLWDWNHYASHDDDASIKHPDVISVIQELMEKKYIVPEGE